MRDDLLRFGTTVMNELGEATVILFNVGLAGADLLPLEPERAEIEGHLAFSPARFRRPGLAEQNMPTTPMPPVVLVEATRLFMVR